MIELMLHPVLAAVLTVGVVVTAPAATFQHQLGQAPGAVLGPDHTPLPATVILTRRWENDICSATVENRGSQPVHVGSVVLGRTRPRARPRNSDLRRRFHDAQPDRRHASSTRG